MFSVAGLLCGFLWLLRKIRQASLNTHPGKRELVTSLAIISLSLWTWLPPRTLCFSLPAPTLQPVGKGGLVEGSK